MHGQDRGVRVGAAGQTALWPQPAVQQRLRALVAEYEETTASREDLFQEAWAHLWRQETMHPGQTLQWYLTSCWYHLHDVLKSGRSLDATKRQGAQLALTFEPDGEDSQEVWPADLPGRGPFAHAVADDLMTFLTARLPPPEQAILSLRVKGHTVREIAHRLRMSVGYVNKHRRHIASIAEGLGLQPPALG